LQAKSPFFDVFPKAVRKKPDENRSVQHALKILVMHLSMPSLVGYHDTGTGSWFVELRGSSER